MGEVRLHSERPGERSGREPRLSNMARYVARNALDFPVVWPFSRDIYVFRLIVTPGQRCPGRDVLNTHCGTLTDSTCVDFRSQIPNIDQV